MHTPAPWQFVAGDGENRAEIQTDNKAICSMWRCMGEDDDANARLIAAAPELLAALKAQKCMACKVALSVPDPMPDMPCPECAPARAAIAKAEGK